MPIKITGWFIDIDEKADPALDIHTIRDLLRDRLSDGAEMKGRRIIFDDIDEALRISSTLAPAIIATGAII